MTGLYALALIGGWLAISWFLVWSWKITRPFTTWPRRVHLVFGFLVLGSWFAWSFWEAEGRKLYWDYQVWQMCQTDGGIEVFLKTHLPKSKFDRWGKISFFHPEKGENALGNSYSYLRDETALFPDVESDLLITRVSIKVVRRSDFKALGESVTYSRIGGGIDRFWHRSAYICPSLKKESLLSRLFYERENDLEVKHGR